MEKVCSGQSLPTGLDKENPFPAKIVERFVLNKSGSTKKTYHLRLDLSGSKISYKVGDAVGIYPENSPEDVENLLKAMGYTGNEIVDKAPLPLKKFLKTKVNLLRIPSFFLKETKEDPKAFAANHNLADFFEKYPPTLPLNELITYFAPLLPRFYSIASSPCISPNHVDLLVATFTYKHGKKKRQGLGSHFLCNQAVLETTSILTFHHPTPHFTLPEDRSATLIMIGPGTGIAPYRAFLQERELLSAPGLNWLFFGERHSKTDYYYKTYLETLKEKNFLRLDLAFSRDQKEKVYVQHHLRENGKAIAEEIRNGAYLYICGDAKRMAKDVAAALHSIIETHTQEDPKSYIKSLRKEKRLLLDVY